MVPVYPGFIGDSLPTFVTHAFVGISTKYSFFPSKVPAGFLTVSVLISIIADFDVICFGLDIPYASFWGHRGFFHSPFFSVIFSFILLLIFFPSIKRFSKKWLIFFLYFSLLGASHSFLDSMTNGGLGIALLSPFTNERYFLPWTPIQVSPISIQGFFKYGGLKVIKSEFFYVWLPLIVLLISVKIKRHVHKKS